MSVCCMHLTNFKGILSSFPSSPLSPHLFVNYNWLINLPLAQKILKICKFCHWSQKELFDLSHQQLPWLLCFYLLSSCRNTVFLLSYSVHWTSDYIRVCSAVNLNLKGLTLSLNYIKIKHKTEVTIRDICVRFKITWIFTSCKTTNTTLSMSHEIFLP